MKIGTAPIPFAPAKRMAEARPAAREEAQRRIVEMKEARGGNGAENPKVRMLLQKFESGRELTPEEMAYLRRHAPDKIGYIEEVSRERKMVREAMRIAPTKMNVHLTAAQAVKHVHRHGVTEENAVRARHIADEQLQYMKTEEYQAKPSGPADRREKPTGLYAEQDTNEYWIKRTTSALLAYQRAASAAAWRS